MERHEFLQGLTWLTPYDEAYNHLDGRMDLEKSPRWPPNLSYPSPRIPFEGAENAKPRTKALQQRPKRSLSSRIILKDASCCFHRGPNVLFFACEKPGDDATLMSIQMAVVDVHPTAFQAAVRRHQRLRKQEVGEAGQPKEAERYAVQQEQSPLPLQPQRPRDEGMEASLRPAEEESSCLLPCPSPSSLSTPDGVSTGIHDRGQLHGETGH